MNFLSRLKIPTKYSILTWKNFFSALHATSEWIACWSSSHNFNGSIQNFNLMECFRKLKLYFRLYSFIKLCYSASSRRLKAKHIHHPTVGRTNSRNCAGVSHRLTFLSTSPKSQSRQKEGSARLTSSFGILPFSSFFREIPIRRRYIPRTFWSSPPRILRRGDRRIGRCDGRGQKRPSRQKVTFRAAFLPLDRSVHTRYAV